MSTSSQIMNGSFPPSSRFAGMRRSAAAILTLRPVSWLPVNATMSTPGCRTSMEPTLAGPVQNLQQPLGQLMHEFSEAPRSERRILGRLQKHRVPRGERRGDLPGREQQRIVPGYDAGHRPDGFLHDESELLRLDRRRQVPDGVACDLTVVVKASGRPRDLIAVLDKGLPALQRHDLRKLVRMLSHPRRDLMEHLSPVKPGETLPLAKTVPRPFDGSIDLLARRDRYLLDVLPRSRVDDPHRAVRHDFLSAAPNSLQIDGHVLRLQVLFDALFSSFSAEA